MEEVYTCCICHEGDYASKYYFKNPYTYVKALKGYVCDKCMMSEIRALIDGLEMTYREWEKKRKFGGQIKMDNRFEEI